MESPPVSSLITPINTLPRRLTSQAKHQFGLTVYQDISHNEHLSVTSSYRRRITKLNRGPPTPDDEALYPGSSGF